MTMQDWDWPLVKCDQQHGERVALLRPIPYELTVPIGQERIAAGTGYALSLNLSSGGMLVLMDQAPTVEQVLKVSVPTPIPDAGTPTLAEVRWARRVPFGVGGGPWFVGLKFLF